MSNLHRILWIDAKIREGRYPNSRTIAEHFEISQRQAQRDVEYLKYSMGAPVEFSTQKNGYLYSDNTYTLPAGYLSDEEKNTLSYLSIQYKMAGGSDALKLASLFSRLGTGGASDNSSSIGSPLEPITVGDYRAENFMLLEKATKLNQKVEMDYSSGRGDKSHRIFQPYKLFKKDGIDYAAGFCELRNEIRVFRISRISDVTILEEHFSVSPLFNESDYGQGKGFNYRIPYTAVIGFESDPLKSGLGLEMVPTAIEGDSEIKQAYNIPFIFKIRFNSSDEILGKLLSKGIPFRIFHPFWLKERLDRRLITILSRNS